MCAVTCEYACMCTHKYHIFEIVCSKIKNNGGVGHLKRNRRAALWNREHLWLQHPAQVGCHLVWSGILQIGKQLRDSVIQRVWFSKSKMRLEVLHFKQADCASLQLHCDFWGNRRSNTTYNLSISLILSLSCWKTTVWKFAYNITSSYSACPYLRIWILEHHATICKKDCTWLTHYRLDSWEQGENKYQVLKRLDIDGPERGQGDRPLWNL